MEHNCNLCNSSLTIKSREGIEGKECRACNLGVFSSSCSCTYETVTYHEYICNNCDIKLDKCCKCDKYFDKLDFNHCKECYEKLKLTNPSDDNNKYEFYDNRGRWEHILKKCNCCEELLPNCNYYYGESESNKKFTFGKHKGQSFAYINYKDKWYTNWCIDQKNPSKGMQEFINFSVKEKVRPNYFWNDKDDTCLHCNLKNKLKELESKYDENYIFEIIEDFNYKTYVIKFKKKCICGDYCDLIEYSDNILNNNDIIQCKDCNPSTEYKKYEYNNNVWHLRREGKKCNVCENIIWKHPYGKWSKIIQCEECDPRTDFIKFKFNKTGWNYHLYKTFDGNRHNWNICPRNIKINYKCNCPKCT